MLSIYSYIYLVFSLSFYQQHKLSILYIPEPLCVEEKCFLKIDDVPTLVELTLNTDINTYISEQQCIRWPNVL